MDDDENQIRELARQVAREGKCWLCLRPITASVLIGPDRIPAHEGCHRLAMATEKGRSLTPTRASLGLAGITVVGTALWLFQPGQGTSWGEWAGTALLIYFYGSIAMWLGMSVKREPSGTALDPRLETLRVRIAQIRADLDDDMRRE